VPGEEGAAGTAIASADVIVPSAVSGLVGEAEGLSINHPGCTGEPQPSNAPLGRDRP
jgi:hypothetical protein